MRKLILLIILWIVVTYYFPDSRSMVKRWTRPLWLPLVEWNAKQEMQQVARDVVDEEAKTGKLPDPRQWVHWLEYRYTGDGLRKDPWGSFYRLQVWADSVGIISYGPDGIRGTADDIEVTAPRRRPGR